MRTFERIRVENGLAYIRDTGISVSELIGFLSEDKSIEDALIAYSDLDIEDVRQAFVYQLNDSSEALRDIKEKVANTLHDIRVPLTSVRGYAELLRYPDIREQHLEEYLEQIIEYGKKTNQSLSEVADAIFGAPPKVEPSRLQAISLYQLIEDISEYLVTSRPEIDFECSLADHLPSIKGDQYLRTGISALVADPTRAELKPWARLEAKPATADHIHIRVQREYENPENVRLKRPVEFLWEGQVDGITLAIAALQPYGNELQFIDSETGIIFEFTLPIWQENT